MCVFALPWPGLSEWYTGVATGVLNVALGKSGPPVAVEFLPSTPETPAWEVRTRVTEIESGRSIMTALDERRAPLGMAYALPGLPWLALRAAVPRGQRRSGTGSPLRR